MKTLVTTLFLAGATCGALIACGEAKPAQDPSSAAAASTDSMSTPASTGASTAMPPMAGMDGGSMPPGHKMP
jgi:hypothetical protein